MMRARSSLDSVIRRMESAVAAHANINSGIRRFSTSSRIAGQGTSSLLRMSLSQINRHAVHDATRFWEAKRGVVGGSFLIPASKKNQADRTSLLNVDQDRVENALVLDEISKIQSWDKVAYRKTKTPWDMVPKYTKKRVSDMVGILTSAHRMEIEQIIDDMQSIADVECYLVIVPTVGYTAPQHFASSLFWNWGIGEPKGNGLLILVAQQEGVIHLVPSPAICDYFHQRFIELVVQKVFQPLVKQGDASYAILQMVYAVARQAHEFRNQWGENAIVPLEQKTKILRASRVLQYGFQSVYGYICVFLIWLLVLLISEILDTYCPNCGGNMHRVKREELLYEHLSRGQQYEWIHGCTEYRVWRCVKCGPENNGVRIVAYAKDFHFSDKCLKCDECKWRTVRLKTTIEKLATKEEDGIKKQSFFCDNCRVQRDIVLPLFRPLDSTPEPDFVEMLLKQAQSPQLEGQSERKSVRRVGANNEVKL